MTKRADMPAPPEPFVRPLAANGLASKPGLYTVGQLVRYAQQYAEQRVREERAEDERLLREAMEAIKALQHGSTHNGRHWGSVRMPSDIAMDMGSTAIAALRKRLGE